MTSRNEFNPIDNINFVESDHLLLCFCSFVCILHNKKLNLPNIFLLLLENKNYRNLFQYMTGIDNDYDMFARFIEYDPTLSKSKYISKYLNRCAPSQVIK
jgi:hypothetical protein